MASPRQRFRAFHVKVNCCGAVRVKAKDFGRTFRGYSSRLLVTDARLEEFGLLSKHHCSTFPECPSIVPNLASVEAMSSRLVELSKDGTVLYISIRPSALPNHTLSAQPASGYVVVTPWQLL